MEDWMTPLEKSGNAIEKAKAALAAGDPKTMHEELLEIPDILTDLLRSLCAAINELD